MNPEYAHLITFVDHTIIPINDFGTETEFPNEIEAMKWYDSIINALCQATISMAIAEPEELQFASIEVPIVYEEAEHEE